MQTLEPSPTSFIPFGWLKFFFEIQEGLLIARQNPAQGRLVEEEINGGNQALGRQ